MAATERITMTMRELDRFKVIQDVADGTLKPWRAAERLGLTVRQIERLVIRYRESGAAGLTSRKRGQQGNRRLDDHHDDAGAALLIALSGNARYLPHLDEARRHRGVEWTADLAEAASAANAQSSACRCCRSIVQLRKQLAELPRVVVRLRPWLSPEALEARANAVRIAYRSGGADAALPIARR